VALECNPLQGKIPMKALARSVIEALLFLEMSGDDIVDPDSALRAMENIAHELGLDHNFQ
jgi:hypothetical protein